MYNLDSSRGSADDVMPGKSHNVQDQRERSREEAKSLHGFDVVMSITKYSKLLSCVRRHGGAHDRIECYTSRLGNLHHHLAALFTFLQRLL